MRNKNPIPAPEKESQGVADGLDYSGDNAEESNTSEQEPTEKRTDIDPNRNYSPYYTPKPKKGSRGGTLGRGAVDASDRKVQFSLTCTPYQKELFSEAAKKDHRKLPDFICVAVEEYIKNHGLK